MYAHPNSGWAPALIAAQPVAIFCKACLGIFVFLSTYGLQYSWESLLKQNMTCAQRSAVWVGSRYIKLISGYWFVWIFAVIVTFFTERNIISVFSLEAIPILSVFLDIIGFGNFLGTVQFCETWWYMSLAILVTMTTPILCELEKRFGLCFVVCCMIPTYVLNSHSVPGDYVFAAFLGVYTGHHNLFEKIHSYKIVSVAFLDRILKIGISIVGILCCYVIRMRLGRAYIVDGLFAFFTIVGVTEFVEIKQMRYLKKVLAFVGSHSMNIFLVHTFIFSYYFTDFIYSFTYPAMITLVLLLSSLLASLIIELLKKGVNYRKLMRLLENNFVNLLKNI